MFEKWIRRLYLRQSGKERISPNDWVLYSQITYKPKDRSLVISFLPPDVRVFGVTDTGSMDGLLDYGHNVILTDNFNPAALGVGDIVAFQVYTRLVLHRIVKINGSGPNRRFRTRGDNCIEQDPYILRDENIKWLLIGIIY